MPGTGVLGVWEEVAQTMYTHISKCKNDKIKREKRKRHGWIVVTQFPQLKKRWNFCVVGSKKTMCFSRVKITCVDEMIFFCINYI
jgi:hypothetical protein